MIALPPDAPPVYVSDTHTLLWHMIGDKKLSRRAASIMKDNETGRASLVIPAVVLAELTMIAEKERTALVTEKLFEVIQLWQTADNIHLTNLTPELIIASRQLTAIPEIFDRLVVAEARALGVPVITKDPLIVGSKLVKTIW